MSDLAKLVVPKDGAPIGNTHAVGYLGVLLFITGVLAPPIANHVFHAPADVVSALQELSAACQGSGFIAAYFGRAANVSPPAGGKVE